MRYKDMYYRALATATVMGWSTVSALAQAGGTTGDPSAPLDLLKTARQKAQSSQLNASSIGLVGVHPAVFWFER